MWDMADVNNMASARPIFKAVLFSLLLADKNRKWQNVHSSEAMSLCFPVVASFFYGFIDEESAPTVAHI